MGPPTPSLHPVYLTNMGLQLKTCFNKLFLCKTKLNKCILREHLKASTDLAAVRGSGRLLQSVEPYEKKASSPKAIVLF